MTLSRRQYLGSLATGATLAVAGCLGSAGGNDDGDSTAGPEDAPPELQLAETTLSTRYPITLREANSETIVSQVHYHTEYNHWHREPVTLRVGRWENYEVVFRNSDREQIPLGEDQPYQLDVARSEDTPRNLVEFEVDGSLLDVRGTEAGGGTLFPRIVGEGEDGWTAPGLPISVQG